MADDVRVTNMPVFGGTNAVALEMWKILRMTHSENTQTVDDDLKLYMKCFDAALRQYPK